MSEWIPELLATAVISGLIGYIRFVHRLTASNLERSELHEKRCNELTVARARYEERTSANLLQLTEVLRDMKEETHAHFKDEAKELALNRAEHSEIKSIVTERYTEIKASVSELRVEIAKSIKGVDS